MHRGSGVNALAPVKVTARPLRRSGLSGSPESPLQASSMKPRADVAQLVEHFTRNEGVPGSSPGVGLTGTSAAAGLPWRLTST